MCGSRPHIPYMKANAEAAGEMVRERDLELLDFWTKEMVIFHDKMKDLESVDLGDGADESRLA